MNCDTMAVHIAIMVVALVAVVAAGAALARRIGVSAPLLLVVIGSGFVALLYVSSVLSRQRQQIEQLVEEIALLSAQVRDLEREHHDKGSAA